MIVGKPIPLGVGKLVLLGRKWDKGVVIPTEVSWSDSNRQAMRMKVFRCFALRGPRWSANKVPIDSPFGCLKMRRRGHH